MKEHPDEQTRYGKLLFSDSLQDYAGWDSKVENDEPAQRIKDILSK